MYESKVGSQSKLAYFIAVLNMLISVTLPDRLMLRELSEFQPFAPLLQI
jgi:hypothetical protein